MPSYVITGVSSGLGFEILRQVSADRNNTVIGLVRNKPATDKKVAEELGSRSNVHILGIADLTAHEDLKRAAAETASITGGALDYLIANAAYVTTFDTFDSLNTLAETPKELHEDFTRCMDVNVVGNIYLFNAFVPLILKGKVKKVVVISSGMADIELIRDYDIASGAIYACSKAAMNVVTAKYSAHISPGSVDVGKINLEKLTERQIAGFGELVGKFQQYQPNFQGPVPTEVAIKDVIRTWESASIEKGDGGAFVSHLGNKQWL
ncbi:NAD(P)-binding protein [Nemania serpens]|nr:NAD(P)-binding protein [Nemania serpens]